MRTDHCLEIGFSKRKGMDGKNIFYIVDAIIHFQESPLLFCCRLSNPDQSPIDRIHDINVWRKSQKTKTCDR